MTMTEPQGRNRSVRRVVAASFIGTTIEWYDFFLYGTAAALVFNKLFFPDVRALVGHAAAPLPPTRSASRPARSAAIIFGHFGDRVGRKPCWCCRC